MGNFLADMLHPMDDHSKHDALHQGILFHRAIDSYTDQHPAVKDSKRRIRQETGKYAPVVLDVYHDLLLVQNWNTFAAIELVEFQEYIYLLITENEHVVPDRLIERLRSMVRHRWLEVYATAEGIESVFKRMAHRASHPEILESAIAAVSGQHINLTVDFLQFFPDLLRFSSEITTYRNHWIQEKWVAKSKGN